MNYKLVFNFLGKTLVLSAILLLIPLFVGVIYQENNFLAFLVPSLSLLAVGVPLLLLKPKYKSIKVREGFVVVALVWIVLSLVGAVPYVISGEIPNYVDALFETASGFSTTGASILSDVESLSKAMGFWRIFAHFIGGGRPW